MIWQYCYFLQSKHRISSLCLPLLSEVDLVFYQIFSPPWLLAHSRCCQQVSLITSWTSVPLASSSVVISTRGSTSWDLSIWSHHIKQRFQILSSSFLMDPGCQLVRSLTTRQPEHLSAVCRRCPWNHDAAFDLPILGRAFWRPFKGRVCTAQCQRCNLVFPWGREALLCGVWSHRQSATLCICWAPSGGCWDQDLGLLFLYINPLHDSEDVCRHFPLISCPLRHGWWQSFLEVRWAFFIVVYSVIPETTKPVFYLNIVFYSEGQRSACVLNSNCLYLVWNQQQ